MYEESATLSGQTILLLSRYSEKGASSRLRTHQFIPYLEAAGAKVTVAPLFDDAYLEHLYSSGGKRKMQDVVHAYFTRASWLRRLQDFSVIWVEKEVFPYFPSFLERKLSASNSRWIIDFDDAIFHKYDQLSSWVFKRLLANKLQPLLAGASVVTAGNEYLETKLRALGAKNTVRIPTVLDVSRYAVHPDRGSLDGRELRIGWVGTPETAKYLEIIFQPLAKISRYLPVKLVTVGANDLSDGLFPIEQHDWSIETEADLISTFDIGVMPLPDAPWERGKCGYKLIQYMAAGKPVVASPVGINKDIVIPEIGFLADESKDWEKAIAMLAASAQRRNELGTYARKIVERKYSLATVAPDIVQLFETAVSATTLKK